MSTSLVLIVVMAVMYASGVYVLLERSLTRVLVGFLLIGNATNLLILLTSGRAGRAPIWGRGVEPDQFADPLPQALILTAIVINFGVTAFLLALIYRSWWLARLGDQGDQLVLEHEEDKSLSEEVFSSASEDDDALNEALDASDEALDASDEAAHMEEAGAAEAAVADARAGRGAERDGEDDEPLGSPPGKGGAS